MKAIMKIILMKIMKNERKQWRNNEECDNDTIMKIIK